MSWVIFAFGSALMASFGSVLDKKILKNEHTLQFGAAQSIFLILVSLFTLPFVNFAMEPVGFLFPLLSGLFGSVAMLLLFKSVRHSDISIVQPMTNISPFFLIVIAYIMLGETISIVQFGGILLLMLGAYALQIGVHNRGFLEPITKFVKNRTNWYLIASMALISVCATLDKWAISTVSDPFTQLFFAKLVTGTIFVSIHNYRYGWREMKDIIRKDKLALGFDAFFNYVGILFIFVAMQLGAAVALAIPIRRMSTLFSTMIGGSLFHEKNLFVKLCACIIMIWGAVLILL